MNTHQAEQTAPRVVCEWFADMPMTSAHWRVGLTLLIAFIIESWEMMIVIFSSAQISADLQLNTAQTGSLIGALFLGMIPGAMFWGRAMSSIGRKKCMLWGIGLYGIFPLISAFAANYETLWVARFLGGMVLASALVVSFPYFEELLPTKIRGKATVYLSAGWPCGVLIAVGVTSLLSDLGWRFVLGAGTLTSLWAVVIWKYLPESPYWLAEKQRASEASEVLASLSMTFAEAKPVIIEEKEHVATGKFIELIKKPLTKITVLQTLINFCFSWGYWAMASWMPTLLAKRGLSSPEGLGFIAISALFMFPGYVTASYLTGRFGRKITMTSFVFFATIAGFGFACSQTITEMYLWNFTLSFFSLGAWGVWNTWLAELYDTRYRGPGTAWGITSQRIANSIAPIAIGAMLASSTFLTTVVFISCFLAVTFIAALLLPETEGKALR